GEHLRGAAGAAQVDADLVVGAHLVADVGEVGHGVFRPGVTHGAALVVDEVRDLVLHRPPRAAGGDAPGGVVERRQERVERRPELGEVVDGGGHATGNGRLPAWPGT